VKGQLRPKEDPDIIKRMSKQKKPAQAAPTQPRSPVITLRLGHGRERQIAEWMAKQRVKPEKTTLLLQAFDEFMEREGIPKMEDEPE
jgi:hypothetical protein